MTDSNDVSRRHVLRAAASFLPLHVGTRVASAMAGGVDLGAEGEAIVAHQATKRVGIIVEAEKVASWDHGKLTAFPGQAATEGDQE